MQTFKPFDRFVCVGDSRSVDVGPFRVVATIHDDSSTRPTDFDCYDEGMIKAWNAGEWHYVGLVLSVWVDDVELCDQIGLWGIDANFPGSDNGNLTTLANEMLPEAIDEGRAVLARLRSVAA